MSRLTNISIRHTGSLLRAGSRVIGNSPLFCRFSIPASSSASHPLATGHSSFAPASPAGSGRARTLPPLATAIHRQPNWQRPDGTRSRRAARPYSVCHRNSACYRTKQFLRANPSVPPRSPPPDRRPFARGRRRSAPVAPDEPAGCPKSRIARTVLVSLPCGELTARLYHERYRVRYKVRALVARGHAAT